MDRDFAMPRSVQKLLLRLIPFLLKGYDADLKTIRMGVRDFDPFIAQFRTPDPFFLGDIDACAGSPVDCNLYGYARDDPLSWIDPSGRHPVLLFLAAVVE